MRPAHARAAFALLALAMAVGPAAFPCAPCCATAAEAGIAAPSCCGCDGSLARPATAERAGEFRRAPLPAIVVAPFVVRLAGLARPAVRLEPPAPIPLGPPSPLPRRL